VGNLNTYGRSMTDARVPDVPMPEPGGDHAVEAAALPAPPTRAIPEGVHDILDDLPTGFLGLMRPDGRISVTPMAVMFDGTHVRLSTVKARKKYRRLLLDDRATVCVPHRNNPNRYVEIRGRAVLSDDPDRSFINSIAKKYMGVDVYPFDRSRDERVTITIAAEQISSPDIPMADNPPQKRDET
jgi:PPOX class probable F420-dependent enzyme